MNENYPIISKIIIDWYRKNKRDLPWRSTNDPYKIWISEIILQQTRVNQGIGYYYKFIEKFPTVSQLAVASEDELLKLWQGLGYYSRARNMHKASKVIHNNFQNIFPDNYNDILKLAGVGEYTAAAIASFAFNKARAVVDGNVYRVLSRVFDISDAIDSNSGKLIFRNTAELLLDKLNPAEHNQAIMEFGALQCTPKNPQCGLCPLGEICRAKTNGTMHLLPIKNGKLKNKKRYFNYICLEQDGSIYMHKRVNNDIWQNLHEFLLIETTDRLLCFDEIIQNSEYTRLTEDSSIRLIKQSKVTKHILSHQTIIAQVFLVSAKHFSPTNTQLVKVKTEEFETLATSKLIEKLWNEINC